MTAIELLNEFNQLKFNSTIRKRDVSSATVVTAAAAEAGFDKLGMTHVTTYYRCSLVPGEKEKEKNRVTLAQIGRGIP